MPTLPHQDHFLAFIDDQLRAQLDVFLGILPRQDIGRPVVLDAVNDAALLVALRKKAVENAHASPLVVNSVGYQLLPSNLPLTRGVRKSGRWG